MSVAKLIRRVYNESVAGRKKVIVRDDNYEVVYRFDYL